MCVLFILFNTMLIPNNIIPDSMIVGTMMSILKCKYKELENLDNYQSITLRKTLYCIPILRSRKQFDFNDEFSANQCINVLLETVNHYNYHDNHLYS